MLLQFEKELAQAVEALTKEQEKAAQTEREKQTQVNCFSYYYFQVFFHIFYFSSKRYSQSFMYS